MVNYSFSLALITGATSGIGEALARLLASKGISLILTGRKSEILAHLAQELSSFVPIQTKAIDLSKSEERQTLLQLIKEQSPDLVINSAGYGFYGDVLTTPAETSLDLIEVNVKALVEITVESARVLVAHQKTGMILNLSSAAAFPVFPGFAVYSASKAFVNQFSESFDEEMQPFGIRILCACPGVVATGFRKNAGAYRSEKEDAIQPMTASYAAQQIWQQIAKKKKIKIFSWRYQLMIFCVRYVLPKKWVAKRVYQTIQTFTHPKEIIKRE